MNNRNEEYEKPKKSCFGFFGDIRQTMTEKMNAFRRKLTEDYSNNYIDWTRTSDFIREEERHSFNIREKFTLGGIILFTGMSGYLGTYFNDKENPRCPSWLIPLGTSMLGLALIHIPVAGFLWKKRYNMSKDCDELVESIGLKLDNLSLDAEYIKSIYNVVYSIKDLSLSDEQYSRSSETWGKRKRLLTCVNDCLDENTFDPDFWDRDVKAIVDDLDKGKVSLLKYTM